ncbi:hypothetical protein A3715_00030 [Oleiphilus sp. HI0009]|nr:hypothetical protein A3715_00030 [Oleiphilus sp. HI0009]
MESITEAHNRYVELCRLKMLLDKPADPPAPVKALSILKNHQQHSCRDVERSYSALAQAMSFLRIIQYVSVYCGALLLFTYIAKQHYPALASIEIGTLLLTCIIAFLFSTSLRTAYHLLPAKLTPKISTHEIRFCRESALLLSNHAYRIAVRQHHSFYGLYRYLSRMLYAQREPTLHDYYFAMQILHIIDQFESSEDF